MQAGSIAHLLMSRVLPERSRKRTGARTYAHQGARGTRGAVAGIGSGTRPGDSWNQTASGVLDMIRRWEENMWLALSSIVLASAIGFNVLALWLTGWFERNQPTEPVFTDGNGASSPQRA